MLDVDARLRAIANARCDYSLEDTPTRILPLSLKYGVVRSGSTCAEFAGMRSGWVPQPQSKTAGSAVSNTLVASHIGAPRSSTIRR
jgi:hypothetical protein